MTNSIASGSTPGQALFHQRQQEYQDYLALTERVQIDLRDDVDQLQSQEGWDRETITGVAEWVDDSDSIWRVLRRNRYDEEQTHNSLLSLIHNRASRSLHLPIPSFPPYSDSSLFYILPLPTHTDRCNRPIVVLSLREVTRDEDGKMDDLKEWTWWALEMVRRILRDWWVKDMWYEEGKRKRKRRGYGGEGCVLLVDAAGAGYRNLEVELLPTLLSVGHNNFPGIFEAVYVVNAGWTHRNMWKIIKRVLPKSALEKVNFLDTKKDLDEIFDLEKLPKIYGGKATFSFKQSKSPILKWYSRYPSYHTSSITPVHSHPISRAASSNSIADIFYTAYNTTNNTPTQSRSASRRQSMVNHLGLRMTRSHGDEANRPRPILMDALNVVTPRALSPVEAVKATDEVDREAAWKRQSEAAAQQPISRNTSTGSLASINPLQRIKSLSNFHLYLSPSRLAHIDILSDSDTEAPPPPPPPPRRLLRPAMLENGGLAARRQRPPLQIIGSHPARSYSDQLQEHHARALEIYREAMKGQHMVPLLLPATPPPEPEIMESEKRDTNLDPVLPDPVDTVTSPQPVETSTNQDVQRISRFSSEANPWYGYPAVRVSDSTRPGQTAIRPKYDRNRKRDLVKTLLFLLILRIQAWRDAFERWLGLNRLGTWGGLGIQSEEKEARNPSEGLLRSALSGTGNVQSKMGVEHGRVMVKKTLINERIWMGVMFLLLRGTWARLLGAPLEAIGLAGIRDMLGLT